MRFSAGNRRDGRSRLHQQRCLTRSDPDVSSPDQFQGNATCSERLGPLRRCDAFVTIRAGDVAVTTIRRDGTRERPRTFFGPYSLQSSSKPPISEAPVRSNDWAALTLLVRNLARTASCPLPETELQGLRELD